MVLLAHSACKPYVFYLYICICICICICIDIRCQSTWQSVHAGTLGLPASHLAKKTINNGGAGAFWCIGGEEAAQGVHSVRLACTPAPSPPSPLEPSASPALAHAPAPEPAPPTALPAYRYG